MASGIQAAEGKAETDPVLLNPVLDPALLVPVLLQLYVAYKGVCVPEALMNPLQTMTNATER